MRELDYRAYWDGAFGWLDYLDGEVHKYQDLWRGVYARSVVPEWAVARGVKIGGAWRLLVINEDWCVDAFNTVPVIARLAEVLPNLDLRVVKRDENLELMDRFLTSGSRSIPLVIALRPDFSVAGRWGPRPSELQEFVLAEKRAGQRPVAEIYREARRWYTRDRGESTVREILDVLASA